ncbi:MAG: acyl-CoA dehydrogenase family protein [Deltaproteobacteria bacterium]|nr:acyl-CoA dehydrogenase family protein [Deltaproteobacteria bacterium]
MNFPPFTEEHALLRKTVRDFVQREIYPHRKEWDDQGEWPARELFKKMADLGLLGIRFDPRWGGAGLDWWAHAAFVEELAHARNGGVSMSILVHTDISTPVIHEIGTDAQREEFLRPAIAAERIGALGITEPGCGSDVAALATTARRDGNDYVINGAKTFITNGAFADFIVLAVRTGEAGHGGISLVLFPTDTPGFTVGKKLDKLGTRSVDSSLLHFDECRIPRRYLLGEENMGFLYIMQNFQGERLVAALMCTSGMEVQLHDAIEYGKSRRAFNKPIVAYQVWRHRFAEHITAIRAAKMLSYHAVDKINSGEDAQVEISMAKLFAGDLAQKVAYDCLQFHGGYGFTEEYDIARAYRDVRLMPIGGGTSEVMKEIIIKWTGMLG